MAAALICQIYLCIEIARAQTPPPAPSDSTPTKQRASDVAPIDRDSIAADLAASDFQRREQATLRLQEAGLTAMPFLEELVQNPDAEIRARAQSILARNRTLILKKNLDEFLRDTDLSHSHDLKAWEPFSRQIGQSRVAKQMLWEIYMAQPQLADALAGDPTTLNAEATRVANQILSRRMQQEDLKVGDGLSLLTAVVLSKDEMPPIVEDATILCVRTVPLTTFLRQPGYRARVDALLGLWIERLSPQSENAGLSIALDLGIESSLKTARRILMRHQPANDAVPLALLDVGRWGNQDDIALIEYWLEQDELLQQADRALRNDTGTPVDPDELGIPQRPTIKRYELRLQDIALACAVKLSGKNLNEYFPLPPRTHPNYSFDVSSLMFPVDDPNLRKQALEKWRNASR